MHIKKLGIDIIRGCQLRCVGCPNSTLKPKIEFCDPADFEKMLNNIDARLKILRLYNFGEPMLHPQLDDMVKTIRKSRLKPKQIDVTTNGQYWNHDVFKRAFGQKIVTHLYVSCDGDGTPEDYERLRPPAKWDKLIEFMVKIKEMRDDLCHKMHLRTRTITTNKYKKRWTKLLKPMGFKPEFRQWTTRTDVKNPPWKARKVPNGVCKYVKSKDLLYVDYDGTVVPCCVHPKAAIYGNLLKTKASEILNGKNRELFYKTMKKHRSVLEVCKDCTKS